MPANLPVYRSTEPVTREALTLQRATMNTADREKDRMYQALWGEG